MKGMEKGKWVIYFRVPMMYWGGFQKVVREATEELGLRDVSAYVYDGYMYSGMVVINDENATEGTARALFEAIHKRVDPKTFYYTIYEIRRESYVDTDGKKRVL